MTVSRSRRQQWEATLQTDPSSWTRKKVRGWPSPPPLAASCQLPLLSSKARILGPSNDRPGTFPASSIVLPMLQLQLMGFLKLQGKASLVPTHLHHRPPRKAGQVGPGRLGAWGHLGGHSLSGEGSLHGGTWVAGVRRGARAGPRREEAGTRLSVSGSGSRREKAEGVITVCSSVVQPGSPRWERGYPASEKLQLCLASG